MAVRRCVANDKMFSTSSARASFSMRSSFNISCVPLSETFRSSRALWRRLYASLAARKPFSAGDTMNVFKLSQARGSVEFKVLLAQDTASTVSRDRK